MMTQLLGAVKDAAARVAPMELRGVDVEGNATPYEVVAARGPMRVLYFEPRGAARHITPIVFSYSMINRWYILDFMPGRSLIEHLTGAGHPCYVIDWGTPTRLDRHKTWGDYALRYLGLAMETACQREGVEQAHLYGYCMGGTLALTYAALRPRRVRSFVAMAVPADFHDEGLLSLWTREESFNVDAVVDAYGNVPTWLMESGFRAMAPMNNLTKWRDLWKLRDKEGFIETWRAMERWASDNVPFPGEVYRQYVRDTYQKNRFIKGEMVVDGARVDLSAVRAPLLVVTAQNDQTVPEASAVALLDVVGSVDKQHRAYPTGHIGLSTSSKAAKVYWPEISAWLIAHGADVVEA
ncbi:alpha/beta fold hydrolase [Myxococcota bacterium]|nr:alpha/beta fold hydrolase [Myxococcota bacterium]MBU1432834.1 alpha/beta fold hydrolase [Myxococcota bacterium]MBU1897540.1 alpha/beta fold hydrolase [Myxococcota bacterium]